MDATQVTAGGDSVHSNNSLKNVGSKVVKGLGEIYGQNPGVSTQQVGNRASERGIAGGGGMAGGMGFGGSMLGEVLISYSTSTLPPAKRLSIAATSAHFEELAAEAGIDLDADEINIEDLRMYRMEEESGYALNDEDSDGEDSLADNLNDDTNAANQKLAHKERSILQMVDVLSERLTSLNAVVMNRYNGCKSDLDEATEFRSSRTKKMAVLADEDWANTTQHRTVDKGKRSHFSNQGGAEGGDGSDIVGPSRMTFRNAPQTDAGRKLAHQFDQEYGLKQASSATPKFHKASSSKLKRMDHHKKNETRKQERLHFERKLQSNLDQYVTRAVTELVYRIPTDIQDTETGTENRYETPAPPVPPPPPPLAPEDVPAVVAGLTDGLHTRMTPDPITLERFPIPMEPNEMNPKLLLSYACERAVLPGGARMFKHFATSLESQQLLVYIFWFMHCKFFQEDSQREQAHLLRSVSSRYVGVLGTDGMEEYKDFFFKHYPFLIANAILWSFHYLCPGSRHLYSNAFKRVVYLQCARILSGVEVTPSSTTEMRTKMFPDETAEALDELEYHPHHVHGPGTRAAGAGGGGTVGGAGSSVPSASTSAQQGLPTSSSEAELGVGQRASDSAGVAAAILARSVSEGGSRVGTHKPNEDGEKERAWKRRDTTKDARESGGTMMQQMSKTFRPDPLEAYTGGTSTLRFKPKRQEGLTTLRPRQQRTIFDASQISPMLQEYLGQSSSTAGRRSENIVRTVPVPWCQSGGSDTYRRHHPRHELHDAMALEYAKAKREYIRGKAHAAEALRRKILHKDAERHSIFKKGPRQVGLKSMDIVTELHQHGALKGVKRPVQHWN